MNFKNTLMKLTVVFALGFSHVSSADSVDTAFRFCDALDATGLLSKPCKVSGWNMSIDVSIDTTSSEARSICQGIAAQAGSSFDSGWKVRIYSPYSSENTIAQCRL